MLEKFIQKMPCACILRSLLERCLNPATLDKIFAEHSGMQYTRTLLFSTVCTLMFDVVLKVYPSALKAYLENQENIPVSQASFYNKLNGIEPSVCQALIRTTSKDFMDVMKEFPEKPEILPGYSIRILDGNCIEASEKRLKVLRDISSAPLPGKSLVVYDPDSCLIRDVYPCQDGHAQERSLLTDVLTTVEARQIWIADRNFCTVNFLSGINQRQAFFIIRKHANTPTTSVEEKIFRGEINGKDKIYEQSVRVGEATKARLIRIELTQKTSDGDTFIEILSNLPPDISAATIAELYRKRWKIETAFQHIEKNLNSEINTLAYPKAALFSFSLALVAYNIFSLMLAAMDSAHPVAPPPVEETLPETKKEEIKPVSEQISLYYLAHEIAGPLATLLDFEDELDWSFIPGLSTPAFAQWLHQVAAHIQWQKLKKSKPRSPKKPRVKPAYDRSKPHASTFRLLHGIEKSP
jgi:hypothetical protein